MIDLTNGVPNLDNQTIENLGHFHGETQYNAPKILLWLFPNHPGKEAQYAVMRLGDYANARLRLLIATTLKDTVRIGIHEAQCKRIYSTLPKFAKWK